MESLLSTCANYYLPFQIYWKKNCFGLGHAQLSNLCIWVTTLSAVRLKPMSLPLITIIFWKQYFVAQDFLDERKINRKRGKFEINFSQKHRVLVHILYKYRGILFSKVGETKWGRKDQIFSKCSFHVINFNQSATLVWARFIIVKYNWL